MKHNLLLSISSQLHNWKGLLFVLLIGAVVGTLTGLIMRGKSMGLLASIIIGIAGGWICNTFFGNFFSLTKSHLVNMIIGATAGAIVLTLLINLIFGGKKERDMTGWKAS